MLFIPVDPVFSILRANSDFRFALSDSFIQARFSLIEADIAFTRLIL